MQGLIWMAIRAQRDSDQSGVSEVFTLVGYLFNVPEVWEEIPDHR